MMAKKKEERFIRTYTQGSTFGALTQIWVDKETGVNYMFQSYGYVGGLTPLLNRDGTPVITPVPKTYEE